MTSSFEEEGEQEEVEVDEDGDEEYFDKSVSSIPVEYENEESEYYYQDGFHSDRTVYEEQDNFQMSDQSFFFHIHHHHLKSLEKLKPLDHQFLKLLCLKMSRRKDCHHSWSRFF